MDAMSRKKSRKAESAFSVSKKQEKTKHASEGYTPKLRPREAHSDFVDSKKRISRNLKKLNKNLVEHPVKDEEEILPVAAEEDRGIKVVTRKSSMIAKIPFAFIFYLVVLASVFMYVVSLDVRVEEYSHSIDVMESRIVELKEEATQLEVQLESKYDLGEIERIATQEYGMVVASSLAKKYISVSPKEDVWEESEKKQKEESFFDQLISGVKTFLGKTEE